jgi:predicted DsbA family dithiol-disulfide isomerase
VRAVEVFADVRCPFTHVGLRRLLERREQSGGMAFVLRVRAWPLELVNDTPLDPDMIAEEVDELRTQVAPHLFAGFDPGRFPDSSLPALMLAAAANQQDAAVGERVSLALRDALFEQGRDIASPEVLAELARTSGIGLPTDGMGPPVLDDWHEGEARGVVGSPHFFVDGSGYFCPGLEITRTDGGLDIRKNGAAFEAFVARCLSASPTET